MAFELDWLPIYDVLRYDPSGNEDDTLEDLERLARRLTLQWIDATRGTPAGICLDGGIEVPSRHAREIEWLLEWLAAREPSFQDFSDITPEHVASLDTVGFNTLSYRVSKRHHYVTNRRELNQGIKSVVRFLLSELRVPAERLGTDDTPSLYRVPLFWLLDDAHASLDRIVRTFLRRPLYTCGIFDPLTEVLARNVARQMDVPRLGLDPNKARYPADYRLPLPTLFEAYLRDTPLLDLFLAKVPVRVTQTDRFSHTHVIGPTGKGKTTLLEELIALDLASPTRPGIVLLTPQGDIVRKLAASTHAERMIVIDPRDIDYPPAINPFALNAARHCNYSRADQERVASGVVEMFDFLLRGLDLELTGQMGTLWRYLARFLLAFPQSSLRRYATIRDIPALLSNPEPYRCVLGCVSTGQRDFLERTLFEKEVSFKVSRDGLRNRIEGILSDPHMERLLSAPETKIDLFEALNAGKVILIDTAQDFLAKASSGLFGRLVLTLIFQAMVEREVIEEGKRHPTFVYVDEAGSYFSGDIADMLRKLRKYRCGLTFAHQELREAEEVGLLHSLLSQPGVRFAAPSKRDAGMLAGEMWTLEEELQRLPKHNFALFVRDVTPRPVPVKPFPLEPTPLSRARRQMFLWRNRDAVSLGRNAPRRTSTPMAATAEPPPTDEPKDEWTSQ